MELLRQRFRPQLPRLVVALGAPIVVGESFYVRFFEVAESDLEKTDDAILGTRHAMGLTTPHEEPVPGLGAARLAVYLDDQVVVQCHPQLVTMLMPLQTELVSRFDCDDLDGDRLVETVPLEFSPGTFVDDDARFCWKGHE
jgi:hypothetical protein